MRTTINNVDPGKYRRGYSAVPLPFSLPEGSGISKQKE